MARNRHARSNPNKSAASSGSKEIKQVEKWLDFVMSTGQGNRCVKAQRWLWLLLPLLRGRSGFSLRRSGVPS
jgi:hypothetical protein